MEISEHLNVQLLNQEGAFWLELLRTQERAATGASVSLPMAEQAIEAVFESKDVLVEMSNRFPWMQWETMQV